VALLALALLARALISRFRPTDTPPVAWPPLDPVPARERTPVTTSTTPPWVDPDGTTCPTSHPLKAKLSSGIYHAPGGLNYDRTRPDRCYADDAAAEADGLRASKR
jgi:hypothetical protein